MASLIPARYRWAAAAAVVAVLMAVSAAGAWKARAVIADRDLSTLVAAHVAELAGQAEKARQAESDARTEERRVALAHQEIQDAELSKVRAQAAAARRAAATADRLHSAAQAYAAGSGGPAQDPATADVCAPAAARAMVLANMLGESEREGLEQAAAATERGRAGDACIRAYEALRQGQP